VIKHALIKFLLLDEKPLQDKPIKELSAFHKCLSSHCQITQKKDFLTAIPQPGTYVLFTVFKLFGLWSVSNVSTVKSLAFG
jgi:hypothetical protein